MLRPLVLSFSSPEFFILTLWGVSMVGILSGNAPVKGLLAGILGVFISTVGLDAKSGIERFAFNMSYLWEGIDLVLVALGIFAIPEVIDLAGRKGTIAKAEEFGRGYVQGIVDVFRHWWLSARPGQLGGGLVCLCSRGANGKEPGKFRKG
jgi:TctA family transporter